MNLTSNNKLLKNITFKSTSYIRNYDFFNNGDNVIIETDGSILLTNINAKVKSTLIGEYSTSLWNLDLMRLMGNDINNLLVETEGQIIYDQFNECIINKNIDLNDYDRILFIHTVVIHSNYRKKGVFFEFIESIYRTYYTNKTLILILAKPFQNNDMDEDYYRLRKEVVVDNKPISALKYYSLNQYYDKTDTELNEYKLYNIVNKCGFDRLSNTNLFKLNIDRFLTKLNTIKFK